MKRPDLATLACGHAAYQLLHRAGASDRVIRQVYGHDRLRLWRCRSCGEACSERRGTTWYYTKLPERKAEEVSDHRGAGWRVWATARLVRGATATVAPLGRVTGWHAAQCHAQHGHGRTPKALASDEPGYIYPKAERAA